MYVSIIGNGRYIHIRDYFLYTKTINGAKNWRFSSQQTGFMTNVQV